MSNDIVSIRISDNTDGNNGGLSSGVISLDGKVPVISSGKEYLFGSISYLFKELLIWAYNRCHKKNYDKEIKFLNAVASEKTISKIDFLIYDCRLLFNDQEFVFFIVSVDTLAKRNKFIWKHYSNDKLNGNSYIPISQYPFAFIKSRVYSRILNVNTDLIVKDYESVLVNLKLKI